MNRLVRRLANSKFAFQKKPRHNANTKQSILFQKSLNLNNKRPLFYLNQIRLYSEENPKYHVIDKKGVKSLLTTKEGFYLIDVREPEELKQGFIETSRNIPVGQVFQAFQLDDKDFEDKYKFEKPPKTAKVVVYCKAGGRSTDAANTLSSLGYTNLYNYVGSYNDWLKPSE